jgi:hypothetical protein
VFSSTGGTSVSWVEVGAQALSSKDSVRNHASKVVIGSFFLLVCIFSPRYNNKDSAIISHLRSLENVWEYLEMIDLRNYCKGRIFY